MDIICWNLTSTSRMKAVVLCLVVLFGKLTILFLNYCSQNLAPDWFTLTLGTENTQCELNVQNPKIASVLTIDITYAYVNKLHLKSV